MIEVRCKLCNTELKSHPTQTRCCGCTNMVTVVGDKITALDLSKVSFVLSVVCVCVCSVIDHPCLIII